MLPKVSIGIVLFGEKYLEKMLPSLIQQDYKNVEFLLLDQEEKKWSASKFIKKNLPKIFNDPRIKIECGENLWHSGGHNKLILKALKNGAKFYICASNDMLYPKNLVSKTIKILEKKENLKFGSAAIKLRRWNFEKNEQTEIIDSCGIGIKKSHHFFDIGCGEKDSLKFSNPREIFGGSGALVIFRKKALEDVAVDSKFFDEKLHYKNDVDLAYRLQWAGWKSLFIPEVVAFHNRQLKSKPSLLELLSERKHPAR